MKKKTLLIFIVLIISQLSFSQMAKSFYTFNVYTKKANTKYFLNEALHFLYLSDNENKFVGYYILLNKQKKQLILTTKDWLELYNSFIYYFSYRLKAKGKKNIILGNFIGYINGKKETKVTIQLVRNASMGAGYINSLLINIPNYGKYYIVLKDMHNASNMFSPKKIGRIDAE